MKPEPTDDLPPADRGAVVTGHLLWQVRYLGGTWPWVAVCVCGVEVQAVSRAAAATGLDEHIEHRRQGVADTLLQAADDAGRVATDVQAVARLYRRGGDHAGAAVAERLALELLAFARRTRDDAAKGLP